MIKEFGMSGVLRFIERTMTRLLELLLFTTLMGDLTSSDFKASVIERGVGYKIGCDCVFGIVGGGRRARGGCTRVCVMVMGKQIINEIMKFFIFMQRERDL